MDLAIYYITYVGALLVIFTSSIYILVFYTSILHAIYLQINLSLVYLQIDTLSNLNIIILLQTLFYPCFKVCFKPVLQSMFEFVFQLHLSIISMDIKRIILVHNYKFVSTASFTSVL